MTVSPLWIAYKDFASEIVRNTLWQSSFWLHISLDTFKEHFETAVMILVLLETLSVLSE